MIRDSIDFNDNVVEDIIDVLVMIARHRGLLRTRQDEQT